LSGAALSELSRHYLNLKQTIKRLSRRFDPRVLEHLMSLPTLTEEALQSAEDSQAFAVVLQERLVDVQRMGDRYDVSVGTDSSTGMNEILVAHSVHGAIHYSRINLDFITSDEYRNMRELGERLEKLFTGEARVERGERAHTVRNFEQALDWLLAEAGRGLTSQRYKGLGEMNPDQLWETTMDPASRRLLKVNIEDGVAADQMFTTLMGDQVEPRREFIEKNALAVANLDI